MQKENIVRELIKRNVITEGTNVHAVVTASGLGGQPIRIQKQVLIGNLGHTSAKGWDRCDAGKDHLYKVNYSDINLIEGMEIARMAQAYKIKIK